MADRPLTVLLAAPQGFAARYLLRTDILPALREAGAKVVVLVPGGEDPRLRAELAADDVVLEPLADAGAILRSSRLRGLFTTLRYFTLAGGARAGTLRHKLVTVLGEEIAPRRPWTARLVRMAVRPLWRSRPLRRGLLALETALDRAAPHADMLDRHRPDLVVTTGPGYFYADALVLREARRRGIRTAAVVLGWDNPTSKGYRGADADLIVVWSERMAEQMARLHDVDPATIAVGGNAHFDRYARPDELLDREEAFAKAGLDPARRLILFATSAPDLWPLNAPLAEEVARAMDGGGLGADAQLLIRVHPNYLLERVTEPIEPLHAIADRHEHVHVQVPELAAGALDVHTTTADVELLAGLLRHCDALVNVGSTMALEALVLDRPVVVLSEALDPAAGGPGRRARRGWDEFDHLQALLHDGGVRVARTREQLVAHLRDALADPTAGSDRRRALARAECGPLDGASGRRIARLLLDGVAPDADAIAAAAAASPLRRGPEFSALADRDELSFREDVEHYPHPARDVVRFIEAKELVPKLRHALHRARVVPRGTVVELGAGTCWLAGALAREPAVERVVAVEFSERRLTDLAPVALAHLGAPAEKVERVVADFYAHGLGDQVADLVVMDAAFHHAADPVALARVAFDLLRPGGELVLLREPTLALLRRTRDHGTEGEHGDFEHEYFARGYLAHLRTAGFEARKAPASGGFRTPRQRALLRPPLRWLNGIAFSEYTYVGRRPG